MKTSNQKSKGPTLTVKPASAYRTRLAKRMFLAEFVRSGPSARADDIIAAIALDNRLSGDGAQKIMLNSVDANREFREFLKRFESDRRQSGNSI